jgi:uncharacterized membrane protein
VAIISLAEINTWAVGVATTVIICIIILFAKKMRSAYVRDERTKKLGAFAAAYSWMFTLITVSFLFWIDHLGIYLFAVNEVSLITGAVMIFSQILAQWYFMRKGDV